MRVPAKGRGPHHPDVERIITLRPDLVLLYGSQADLITQLTRASIPYFEYRHSGLSGVTETIRRLGQRLGHATQANALTTSIESRLSALRQRTAKLEKPRTLLVFGRERGSLRSIYASGGRGFLHDMLEAAGGINVFADVQAESVEASTEMVLTRAPDGDPRVALDGPAGRTELRDRLVEAAGKSASGADQSNLRAHR